MPQDSGALRVDGGDYAAQVGRFGETTLPFFHPSCSTSLRHVDLRHPFGAAPFGPTFGCSISRLPQRSVLKILLIMSRLSGFLKFAGEGFDVRASDRRAEQAGELGGITDELDLFAKPFRHCPETDL